MASYEQRGKNKLWSVRFSEVEDGKETQKRLSGYKTKKECQAAYHKYIEEYKQRRIDKINSPNIISFSQLYNTFKEYQKQQIKESSYYDFCSKSDLHIYPYFSKFNNVLNIKPIDILEWQKTKESYSYKYKMNLRIYLSSIFRYAEKYYNIPNPVRKTDTFKNNDPIKEMQVWTMDEFNAFIEQVEKLEYKAFFTALYFTGARKGEMLATTWKDWDLINKQLNINKTLTKKVFDAPYSITKPKNNTSIRKVSIPARLLNIMKELKSQTKENRFVFYGDKPLADASIGRVKDEACQKADVKNIRIHDFRHSHASYLFSQHITPMAVAKRLGHKDVKETLNTYAHMLPQEEDIILSILDSKIG